MLYLGSSYCINLSIKSRNCNSTSSRANKERILANGIYKNAEMCFIEKLTESSSHKEIIDLPNKRVVIMDAQRYFFSSKMSPLSDGTWRGNCCAHRYECTLNVDKVVLLDWVSFDMRARHSHHTDATWNDATCLKITFSPSQYGLWTFLQPALLSTVVSSAFLRCCLFIFFQPFLPFLTQ